MGAGGKGKRRRGWVVLGSEGCLGAGAAEGRGFLKGESCSMRQGRRG